jgi:hypothetical protein
LGFSRSMGRAAMDGHATRFGAVSDNRQKI